MLGEHRLLLLLLWDPDEDWISYLELVGKRYTSRLENCEEGDEEVEKELDLPRDAQ